MTPDTKPQLLLLPKNSGITESDRQTLVSCGYLVVEVEDPHNFVQSIPVAPITLAPDAITKALFHVVFSMSGGPEAFGRAIANFIHHGHFAGQSQNAPAKETRRA